MQGHRGTSPLLETQSPPPPPSSLQAHLGEPKTISPSPPLLQACNTPGSPRHCAAEEAVLQLEVTVYDHGLAHVVQVGERRGDVAAPAQGIPRIIERSTTVQGVGRGTREVCEGRVHRTRSGQEKVEKSLVRSESELDIL